LPDLERLDALLDAGHTDRQIRRRYLD